MRLLLLGKIGWAFLVLIYVVLRAMWVRLEPPQGTACSRAPSVRSCSASSKICA